MIRVDDEGKVTVTRVSSRIAGLAVLVAAAAVYFVNPFGSASYNVFGRLLGLQAMRVPSASMEPTIRQGSYVVVSVWPYLAREPRRGDVVVFRYPLDPSVSYAKRILGSAGSTISMQGCRAVVDGRALAEPYVLIEGDLRSANCQMADVHVPPGQYFVLSDNRLAGPDSRVWGFVPRANIYGKVLSH
jgi:signal peptidase I